MTPFLPVSRARFFVWAVAGLSALLIGGLIAKNDLVFLLAVAVMLLTALFVFRRADLGFAILFASAFFFAPLKDYFASTLVFFMVDLVIFVMAAIWFMQKIVQRRTLFPRTPLTAPILLMAAYSGLLLANPDRNILASLAGYRSWNLGAVMFFLAYDFIDSARTLRRYFALFAALGLGVALYGVYQHKTGINQEIQDPHYRERHMNVYYSTSKGTQFRPFSTTVSAAELATTMAFLCGITMALFRTPLRSRSRTIFWVVALMLFLYVLLLTASRTVQISFAFALLAMALLRRNLVFLGGLLLSASVVFAVTVHSPELQYAERFKIFQSPELRGRLSIPIERAWQTVLQHPFGMGLGYTQGVPLHLLKTMKIESTNIDNGFGAALIEMGWLGLLLYVYVLSSLVRCAWSFCRDAPLSERPIMEAAFIAALSTLVSCIAGNGLYGYPHALLLWFILGGAAKIADLHREPFVFAEAF